MNVTLEQFLEYMEEIKNHIEYHERLEMLNIEFEDKIGYGQEINIDFPIGIDVAIKILENLFNDTHYIFLWIFDSKFGFFSPKDFDKTANFNTSVELYYFLLNLQNN